MSRFADDQDAVISERSVLVTLERAAGDAVVDRFRFPAAVDPTAKLLLQRYDDADLVPAEAELSLTALPGRGFHWWTLAIPLVIAGLVLVLRFRPRAPAAVDDGPALHVPSRLTPFTVLAFLRALETRAGQDEAARRELRDAIDSIERHWFAESPGDAPDLRLLVDRFARRAS